MKNWPILFSLSYFCGQQWASFFTLPIISSLYPNPIKNQNDAGRPNSLLKAVCCLLAILCGLPVQLSCSAFHRRACKLPLILNKSIQIFRIYEYKESCFLSHCISSLAFFPLPASIKIFFFSLLMTWDTKSAEIFNIFFPIFCMIIVVMINAATIYILQVWGYINYTP